MNLRDLLRMLQRRWLTIVAFTLLGLLGSAALTFTQTPQYQSSTRIFVATASDGSIDQAYVSSFYALQRVKSYAELATSREVMQRVIVELNLNTTPTRLASRISSTVQPETVIIQTTVTDSSAGVAQQIAKAHSEILTQYLGELESPDKGSSTVKATIVDPASYDASQVSPRVALNLATGILLGLLIGVALAIARELLDNRIATSEDVEVAAEAPVLTSIRYDNDVPKQPLIVSSDNQFRTEAFRLLRTNLQFLNLDTRPRALVITSAVPGEGKTSTATNLAIALAQTGQRILLVDGDLRRPKAAQMLGLERSVGLTTVLVGRSELHESIQKHSNSGIFFLASGPIPPNPTEVLQSNAAHALFDQLSDMFDMVIIDAPPLLPVSDAAIMARDVDGAILVVRHGKTTKEQVRQARSRLTQVGANLFGVAVNMTPKRGRGPYGYSYEYTYEPVAPKRVKTG